MTASADGPIQVGEEAVKDGDADVGPAIGVEPVPESCEHALVDHRHVPVVRASTSSAHAGRVGPAPQQSAGATFAAGWMESPHSTRTRSRRGSSSRALPGEQIEPMDG